MSISQLNIVAVYKMKIKVAAFMVHGEYNGILIVKTKKKEKVLLQPKSEVLVGLPK